MLGAVRIEEMDKEKKLKHNDEKRKRMTQAT